MENSNECVKTNEFISSKAVESGYEVVDILTRGGKTFSIEVVLDKAGGITLDECASFNRDITSWIEDNGFFENGFTVDVCSPGLDRDIKSDRSFKWAIGRNVEVHTHSPVEGSNVLRGKLLAGGCQKGVKIETEDDMQVDIEPDNVAKIKLWVSI